MINCDLPGRERLPPRCLRLSPSPRSEVV